MKWIRQDKLNGYLAKDLFENLGLKNYRQWIRDTGAVKVEVEFYGKTMAIDVLPDLQFLEAVFGSRSPRSTQVRLEVMRDLLGIPMPPREAPEAVKRVLETLSCFKYEYDGLERDLQLAKGWIEAKSSNADDLSDQEWLDFCVEQVAAILPDHLNREYVPELQELLKLRSKK